MSFKPNGIWDDASVAELVKYVEERENSLGYPFNRFTDTTRLRAIDVEQNFIYGIALPRRSFSGEDSAIKSAFYVSNPAAARVVRVHASANEHAPLQVKVFEDLDSAALWLGVRRRMLEV